MTEPNLTTTAEIWLPVVGYEEHYEVSNLGRVRRIKPYRNTFIGRILSLLKVSGYYRVVLYKDNKINRKLVHRLVAEAFIGPSPNGYHVNHKDGIKTNNYVDNLEYVTPKENQQHAARIGLMATLKNGRHGFKAHPEKWLRGDTHYSRTHPEKLARGDRNGSKTHPEKVMRGDQHPNRLHPERMARGERNGFSKLTKSQIIEIRNKYIPFKVTLADLGKEYGVSLDAIWCIIHRRNWKHIA